MKSTLCAAALVIAACCGCGGSSSGGSGAAADNPSSSDPAVQIAALASGDPHPSAATVASWRSKLGLLETYCQGDDRFISDTVVQARKTAKDHGANVSYDDAAAGITREASAAGGSAGQDCDRLAVEWVASVSTK